MSRIAIYRLLRVAVPIIGTHGSAQLDRATEQMRALRDVGVARVMCQHLVHEDLEELALLGEELAPRVA